MMDSYNNLLSSKLMSFVGKVCENFGGTYSFIGCEYVDWSVTAVE